MKPLYAIRHIPTGHFLPEPKGKMGRGGSWTEPIDCTGKCENPRLFRSELSAKRALTAWLQGTFIGEWDEGYSYVGDVCHQPHRIKEEMKIVSFQLMLEEKQ